MKPVVLAPNQFPHFYRGGEHIARWRGVAPHADDMPEDWVASTTTRFGARREGLSVLPDGRLLRDAITDDPRAWLGDAHVETFGAQLGMLVKLLDTSQRLVVHAHPDRRFAADHLRSDYGKTEAWVVMETQDADAVVYLGFRDDVAEDDLRRWVSEQDVEAMLGALHRLPVTPGDTVLVPGGMPHAIGAGVFVLELQEPTDFSVLLEWKDFAVDGPADGHLGLGYDTALGCVDRRSVDEERLSQLRGPFRASSDQVRLFSSLADPFFRADRLGDGAQLEPSVSVLIVTEGAGELHYDGGLVPIRHGHTLVVPWSAGTTQLRGEAAVIRCRPPAPVAS